MGVGKDHIPREFLDENFFSVNPTPVKSFH